MSKDFSQHLNIISQFRGKVLTKEFEPLFAVATKHVPKTEKFLLKMELKRLAGPCTRLIDLRGNVDGECRAYEHDTRTHYLDPLAIRVFEENIEQYNGYTFGVYEAVNNTENNFRVIYQKEKRGIQNQTTAETTKIFEKLHYPATISQFGPYFNRSEERMNFAITINAVFENKKTLEVLSSDISISGCKIRVKGVPPIKVGEQIILEFLGFAQEFQFGEQSDFDYRVRNVATIDDTQLVGLERILIEEKKRDPFKHFLKGYIQGNKRRYKINLDNTISALQARSLETFTLPKINELPIFVAEKGKSYVAKYALTCPNNRELCYYWQDEKRQSTLDFLVTSERIQRLQKLTRLGKSLSVYTFKQLNNGKVFFYSFDSQQLKEDKTLFKQLLGFFSNKASFIITDLSLAEVNAEKAYSPLALADTLTKKNEYLNMPPVAEVKKIVSTLKYVVVAQKVSIPSLIQSYQTLPYEGIDMTMVKQTGHKKSAHVTAIDEVGINYKNQRQELRFKYETPAVVIADGVQWQGISRDFSMSGLKVELDKTSILNKGDIVQLTFPKLQKITSSFDLKDLPYEIVRISKNKKIINLKVFVEQHQHIGRSFFRLLIDKNRDKLTPDDYAFVTPGLAKALRNIYSASIKVPYLMVQISGSRYKAETLSCSDEYGKILPAMKMLSEKRGTYNLYPLLSNPIAQAAMTSKLKKMQPSDQPFNDMLYISIRSGGHQVDEKVTAKLISQLESIKLKRLFISNALKSGDFYAIQFNVSRVEEPDMQYLSPELNYISAYALHRGKQIEQEIWSVAGVVQLYDMTSEVIQSYMLSNE